MITRIQIGVDVSKAWFDVHMFIRGEDFTARYPNNPSGFKAFKEKVQSIGARKVHVCMEFTGGYETPLALFCKECRYIVSIVDGARIHHYGRSFTSTGSGSDKKSAYLLARYCKERSPEEWFQVPDEYRKLRELVRHRERLIGSKTEWTSRSGFAVEDALVSAQRKTVIEVYKELLKATEERIQVHIQSHANLKKAMKLLISIPSIGFVSAARILGESGPIENFLSARSYALYAGLLPIFRGSGTNTPPGKLPVYGNKELRSALYFPAIVSKRTGKGVGGFILKLCTKEDTAKMSAIVAGMRKLSHVIYGILNSGDSYDSSKLENPPKER